MTQFARAGYTGPPMKAQDPGSGTPAGSQAPAGEATRLLRSRGQSGAASGPAAARLSEIVHGKLRGLAGVLFEAERGDHTLQPTALAHEAYLKLIEQERVSWQDEAHFLAIAAQAMRRILVDHARARGSLKRGVGWEKVEIESGLLGEQVVDRLDVVAVHEALERLRAISERQARIAELRFFGGLSMEAVAEVMETSLGTIKREWRFAKAWLARALKGGRD